MNSYNLSQASRILGLNIGRNKIFKILIREGIIDKWHIPKQEYIATGLLEIVCEVKLSKRAGEEITHDVLHVTKEGLHWLYNLLKDYNMNLIDN